MRVDLSNGQIDRIINHNKKDIIKLNINNNKLVKLPDWLSECTNLQILCCNYNKLTELPDNLPKSLKELFCHHNKLQKLSDNLPKSLKSLYCDNNKLKKLPKNLPELLQELFCNNNKLDNLPNNLPNTLEIIVCSDNKLKHLPEILPQNLHELYCDYNKLKQLPETLPRHLQVINCNNNKLINLPEKIPPTIVSIDICYNRLNSLPLSLINCIDLKIIYYDSNPLENIHPVLQRFLNRRKNNILSVYNDKQSVHNHNIQESIKKSIMNILQDTKTNLSIDSIINDVILTDITKAALIEYLEDPTEHSVLMITFKDLLIPVWNRIIKHKESEEIKRILNQEMNDSECKCFTGRLSRLVNCLNGFYDDVEIKIGMNEQIGNIIVMIKEQLGKDYNIDHHKYLVRKELKEREYSENIIEEWISFIDA